MTELLIDGVSVVLSKDFNIQVKRENPFFTRNGEYTYDITLKLDNKINAELYNYLNRVNITQMVQLKRSAILVVDNRVYCDGVEIITGWTDKDVSIQIASGNSELNYFIGNDLQISSLKMKTTAVKHDLKYVEKQYPEIDYCLAPIVNREAGYCLNKWKRVQPDEESTFELLPDSTQWAAQPYLCAYLKELLQSLEYELVLNQLDDTIFKDLFICHVEEVNEWNKMLPGWSVKNFLEQIEKLFNMVFVIDNRKRTARLMFQNNFYNGSANVHLQQVTDVYETEIEETPELNDHTSTNIHYNFPDNEYWRWRCVPDEVMAKAKKDKIPADFHNTDDGTRLYYRIYDWFSDDSHKKQDTIYTDERDGREYLYMGQSEANASICKFYMLNEFKSIKHEDTENTLELDIMPVELVSESYTLYHSYGAYGWESVMTPVIDGSNYTEGNIEGGQNIDELIQNGVHENSESKEKIFLAFYTGMNNRNFPQSYTDEYSGGNPGFMYYTNKIGQTFRLSAMSQFFYQNGYSIDFTKCFKIQTYDPNVYDTRLIFEAHNKRYVCKDMEFTMDTSGRKGICICTVYPIKISDTEAEQRWLLTDGKWRDGGTWTENGRWLDD